MKTEMEPPRQPVTHSGAVFSPCERYRYRLWRVWTPSLPPAVFVMLNPSTASHLLDDPTIRRCMRFAYDWSFGGIDVVNLFAWRSADPRVLAKVVDPVGPESDYHITKAVSHARCVVVAAWGSGEAARDRAAAVVGLIRDCGVPLMCLGETKSGSPRHPLYMPASTTLKGYNPG